MTTVASSVETALDTYGERLKCAFEFTPRSEALEVASNAIEVIEEEEGLSDEELMQAAMVVKDPTIANIYLRMKRKSARSAFLRCQIEEFRK
jgi:hypothetical protein